MKVQHDCLLEHPFQVQGFFLPRTATNHFHVARVQRKLVTPASVSPAPPVSSPSPDASGGTNLQVFDASDCSTLRMLLVYHMKKGGLKEFWVTGGGCYIIVLAKPLQPVVEAFYSLPIDGANCWDFDRQIPRTLNYRGLDRQIL